MENTELNIKMMDTNVLEAIEAIEKNDNIKLEKLISEGLDPNERDEQEIPLIHIALKMSKANIVETLLKSGADVNLASPEKVIFEVKNKITELTGEKVEINNLTPLMSSILGVIPKVDEKVKVNDSKSLIRALLSITSQTDEKTNLLLKYNADVNIKLENGFTALHFAANKSKDLVMKKLIEKGANVNAIAMKNDYKYSDENDFKSNITPILLAANLQQTLNDKSYDKINSKSSDCLKILFENGADINLNTSVYLQSNVILQALNFKYTSLATKVLNEKLQYDFDKMTIDSVEENIKLFLNIENPSENDVDLYVKKILNSNVDFKTQTAELKYFTHLQSWNEKVPLKIDEQHKEQASEGWIGIYHVPKKINHLLILLKDVETEKVNCEEAFGENKSSISNKLKNEIWNQTSTYFTEYHIRMMNSLNDPQLHYKMKEKVFEKWTDTVANLKPDQSFSMGAGTNDHAVFLEFKKQKDNNVSRIIYNLGGASGIHSVNLEGKLFPHVVENIPGEIYKKGKYAAMDYFETIVDAKRFPCYKEKQTSPTFEAVYEKAYLIGGTEPSTMNDYTAMKQQMVGNCSVKNNLNAIQNRFQNNKLYEYLKNLEIENLRKSIDVPDRLFKKKELEKDLADLNYVIRSSELSVKHGEKRLWDFIQKRSTDLSEEVKATPGERIAEGLNKLKDSNSLYYYISNKPKLIDTLDKISKEFKNENLSKIVKEYSLDFEVKKNERKQEVEGLREKMLKVKSKGIEKT